GGRGPRGGGGGTGDDGRTGADEGVARRVVGAGPGGGGPGHGLLVRGGRLRAVAGPPLALAAGGDRGALARGRPRVVHLDGPAVARLPRTLALRRGDLRAAYRDLHARGHLRR